MWTESTGKGNLLGGRGNHVRLRIAWEKTAGETSTPRLRGNSGK